MQQEEQYKNYQQLTKFIQDVTEQLPKQVQEATRSAMRDGLTYKKSSIESQKKLERVDEYIVKDKLEKLSMRDKINRLDEKLDHQWATIKEIEKKMMTQEKLKVLLGDVVEKLDERYAKKEIETTIKKMVLVVLTTVLLAGLSFIIKI